jgi:hypothetical protein
VRSPAGALWRWSDRHQSQLATIGLAAVLVLLAEFSLWAAMQTNVKPSGPNGNGSARKPRPAASTSRNSSG